MGKKKSDESNRRTTGPCEFGSDRRALSLRRMVHPESFGNASLSFQNLAERLRRLPGLLIADVGVAHGSGGPSAPAMNNFGNGIRKRKAPRIEARGRRPGQKPCPGALIGRETVSRKVAAASPFEQIGEEAARIASRGSSFSISHKHGRDSTTVGRQSRTTV